jgi:hypothetical protein
VCFSSIESNQLCGTGYIPLLHPGCGLITKNRPPSMCITVLRRVPAGPLPSLAEEKTTQQGEVWENMTTRPSCGILGLLGHPSAAAGATSEADQSREATSRPSWRSATVSRLVPAPVPAAAPLGPLRLCYFVWAWSMRDGADHMQAKAWAMKAFSWWLLSGHSPQSPPPWTRLPPSTAFSSLVVSRSRSA